MKRSEELLGLSVISIEDGKEIGRVSDFVINSAEGMVEYLIIDNGYRYMGIKILPFKMVEGVGEYAVTILSSSSITDLTDEPEANGLLEKNVRVKGIKVLTKKGRLIGSVSEFIIDDDNEGKISSCEVTPISGTGKAGFIATEHIITFGKDVLVVAEDAEPIPPIVPEPPVIPGPQEPPQAEVIVEVESAPPVAQPTQAPSVVPEKESCAGEPQPVLAEAISTAPAEDPKVETGDKQEPSQAAKLFEERQRKYLLGRKASKRIESDSGELVAEEGETITDELLDKAKAAGKFTELSMNSRA